MESKKVGERVCKECLTKHARVYSGRAKNCYLWRDENGLLWNGRLCGLCNRKRLRMAVPKSRADKKKASNEPTPEQN